jgi:hypothetical protein
MNNPSAPPISILARPGGPGLRHCRDQQLLTYVACQGVVTIEHVMAALMVGRTAAYRRVAHCLEASLLERLELLRTEPSLLRATRMCLRYLGLNALPLAEVSAATAPHWLRCASIARLLVEREFYENEVFSERDLRLSEQFYGRPLASAKVGELPSGGPRYHRPDLAVISSDRVIAIEVELSLKAPRRLEAILRGWRRAAEVAEVRYYCAPGSVTRGLQRAVSRTATDEKVRIFEAPAR